MLDTNIIIYASLPDFHSLRHLIQNPENATSIVSKVEVLGYLNLKTFDKVLFQATFETLQLLPVNLSIIDKAIELRQQRKMSLGDSIIAATALVFDAELYTRNIDDFKHIQEIKVSNPID
ncbi:type II toxin-antitoxin system VapC family toxin [Arcicella aquatica]|uniref:Type II toxin-antitoxin system VapC family toxin n=1 Tax=Arcicella aquatica TaxID=217141 RepID=A0ABU5QT65_9BACT|nr:type II toxin-antitoxin system VapC family toxin [Arcicella aquatica]MEA5260287.1 type II toxin-antitoxin system VapC family toxin [Arcicella aquatica]